MLVKRRESVQKKRRGYLDVSARSVKHPCIRSAPGKKTSLNSKVKWVKVKTKTRQHKQLNYFILHLGEVQVYLQGTLGDLQTNLKVFTCIASKSCHKIFRATKFVTSVLSLFC